MARMTLAVAVAVALAGQFGALPAQTSIGTKPFSVVELHPSQGDLAILLRAQVAAAIKAGRKPFVELVAKSCGPCRALDASLNDPAMIDAFSGTAIVKVDLDEWKAQLRAVNLPDDEPVPAFYRLDNDGRVTTLRIDGEAWGADLPINMAPPLKAFFSKT
jgi:hypothetical protein